MNLPEFTLIEQEQNRLLISVTLDEKSRAFAGHFPQHPILPGVIQLDWVMQLAHRFFNITEPAAKDFQVKFTDMVGVGTVLLQIEHEVEANRLAFSYSKQDKTASSGKIKLG